MKSDLHAMSKLNTLFKYADDTTLIVPEHTDVSICDEFEHVKVCLLYTSDAADE